MRSLEDIFYKNPTEREIRFEKGFWCIYRRSDVVTEYTTHNGIYVIHRCVKTQKALNYLEWRCGNGMGYGCGKVAPEGIQALYILSGWDER